MKIVSKLFRHVDGQTEELSECVVRFTKKDEQALRCLEKLETGSEVESFCEMKAAKEETK